MPFTTPSLTELVERNQADMESRLPGADAAPRRSNVNALSRVHSGVVHGLYGFQEWIWAQVLTDTAEAEMLDRHGSIWGIGRIAATYAQGNVELTGPDGTEIPAGTLLQRSGGREYRSEVLVTIADGVATAAVTASLAGAEGNAAQAAKLSLVSPIAGVDNQATAADGLTNGTDEETDDSLRARILDRIRQPPHGGAGFDYSKWTFEVLGVTRVWVYPKELGLGTVTIRFMMDDTHADGIPSADDVAAVQAHIDRPDKRPVTAEPIAAAPIGVALNLTISGLAAGPGEDINTVRAAIEAEVRDLLRREAEPGKTILISHIREAISIAAGEHDHTLVAPVADVAHATGAIAVMGVITWT